MGCMKPHRDEETVYVGSPDLSEETLLYVVTTEYVYQERLEGWWNGLSHEEAPCLIFGKAYHCFPVSMVLFSPLINQFVYFYLFAARFSTGVISPCGSGLPWGAVMLSRTYTSSPHVCLWKNMLNPHSFLH